MKAPVHHLKEDVLSTFNKGYIYGKKGEAVKEIIRNGDVIIVEGKRERFPVRIEKLLLTT